MRTHKERLELNDSGIDILMKLSDGNPGAITVLSECIKRGAEIDPDSAFGGLTAAISFDVHGIYGSDIWILYKNVCGSDVVCMHGFLRAVQLGIATDSELKQSIQNEEIDKNRLDELISLVKERLPNFASNKKQELVL